MNRHCGASLIFFGRASQGGAFTTGKVLTLNSGDLNDRIIQRVDGKASFDAELFTWLSTDLISALDAKPARLSDEGMQFVYQYQSDAFRTAQELNLFHFSASKDLAEMIELNRLYRDSTSFADFHKKAIGVTDVFNKKWQQTEYETATLISESHDNYYRLKSKTDLFPFWEYKTVGDNKVRPEHQKLNGLILPANDPLWDIIWPPNGWKCRCYVVARMKHEVADVDFDQMREKANNYLKTEAWQKDAAQGFGINRALSPELFTANQMYIRRFPDNSSKQLSNINYQLFGLGSYEQNRAKALFEMPVYEGTSKSFFEALDKQDGKVFFKDYNKRSVLFDEAKYIKGHDEIKYAQRTKLLTSVAQALEFPDEVWVNGPGLRQYTFIKYYKDKTIAVVAEINNGTVYRVRTWFDVTENAETKKYRTGLPIKTKP